MFSERVLLGFVNEDGDVVGSAVVRMLSAAVEAIDEGGAMQDDA